MKRRSVLGGIFCMSAGAVTGYGVAKTLVSLPVEGSTQRTPESDEFAETAITGTAVSIGAVGGLILAAMR